MPARLSATGCVDPSQPTRPAETLIPYAVAAPLWSDAADKQRFFALPDGATIHVKDCAVEPDTCRSVDEGGTYEDEGDWDFPVGAVLMKTFAFAGKLIETRLLVRAGEFDYWGYSYAWRADQSDAELLPANVDGYDREVDMGGGERGRWHFPSRAQCLNCHTTAAGVSLGPETSQLNVDFTYPNGVRANQLDTLSHARVFDRAPEPLPAYPDPAGKAELEPRARAYLHANCAICHRPGGNFTGIDLRFRTSLADTNLCGVAPEKGDLGTDGALKIAAGDAERSALSLRMHSLNPTTRMPPLGTSVVDLAGTALVDAWIDGLERCP